MDSLDLLAAISLQVDATFSARRTSNRWVAENKSQDLPTTGEVQQVGTVETTLGPKMNDDDDDDDDNTMVIIIIIIIIIIYAGLRLRPGAAKRCKAKRGHPTCGILEKMLS
ncbi:uncharacterized protein UV8b_05572 [Ustilaginoidea virens]|uniref:Uncharacterized protein n=1 Tax=Ustilaginoidea virens TaxID=1159556 RepID=A0A8E5HU74_USTVR|nr:uncharacterized protein UV8b_05572 [Ustilaginoidea virens]QUC21329.1 hypothetical protein UV8b_05572 [Ustilaginoidea virens]